MCAHPVRKRRLGHEGEREAVLVGEDVLAEQLDEARAGTRLDLSGLPVTWRRADSPAWTASQGPPSNSERRAKERYSRRIDPCVALRVIAQAIQRGSGTCGSSAYLWT